MKALRRKDRGIPAQKAQDLIAEGEFGVLSTVDADGQPYGVPLNYALVDNSIYVHSAKSGHKLGNMDNNPKVSFCVVGHTKVLPDEFATEYESAIAFGTASEVTGEEKMEALLRLLEKYSPAYMAQGKEYIATNDMATKVIKIAITDISGKARR